MKRILLSNKLLTILLFVFLLSLLTSCQQDQDDEDFQITVFTNLPESSFKEMKGFAEGEIGSKANYNIVFYPSIPERLIVEVVGHRGDIIIMERELLPSIYDSEGLYQLDDFKNEDNTIKLNDFELEALLADDEFTEEVDIYRNALRVINLAPFLKEDTHEASSVELVAIIPKYTEYKDASFSILERLVER